MVTTELQDKYKIIYCFTVFLKLYNIAMCSVVTQVRDMDTLPTGPSRSTESCLTHTLTHTHTHILPTSLLPISLPLPTSLSLSRLPSLPPHTILASKPKRGQPSSPSPGKPISHLTIRGTFLKFKSNQICFLSINGSQLSTE